MPLSWSGGFDFWSLGLRSAWGGGAGEAPISSLQLEASHLSLGYGCLASPSEGEGEGAGAPRWGEGLGPCSCR